MFVLTWSYPYDGEHNVTVWQSHDEAWKAAAGDMQEEISNSWDMSDVDQATEATHINDLVANGRYKEAVQYFNDCSVNCDNECAMYWHVEDKAINQKANDPSVFLSDFFTALNTDDDEDEDDDIIDAEYEEVEEPYQASTPGATCRGPSCGYHSPDAYADKRDGTFVCYQCKMMSKVFGTTIK